VMVDPRANDLVAEFVRDKIRSIVHDPETARKLLPSQTIGCKRICLDDGYYETFNRPNVHLVDLKETPIEAVTPTGVRTSEGEVELDCLVMATGFDAMTGTLLRMAITGRDGVTIQDAWHAGPRTYLGIQVPGFPNLFTITGPGSPSVLTNMIVSIEHHVGWVADAIAHLRANGLATIEATDEAAEDWVHHVNAVADTTLYPTCNSWYLGANVPGKTRVFMPLVGYPQYVARCAEVAEAGYDGFALA
jgi:cation diffusion facilitator CzcD-associated flavoprotein CzcO